MTCVFIPTPALRRLVVTVFCVIGVGLFEEPAHGEPEKQLHLTLHVELPQGAETALLLQTGALELVVEEHADESAQALIRTQSLRYFPKVLDYPVVTEFHRPAELTWSAFVSAEAVAERSRQVRPGWIWVGIARVDARGTRMVLFDSDPSLVKLTENGKQRVNVRLVPAALRRQIHALKSPNCNYFERFGAMIKGQFRYRALNLAGRKISVRVVGVGLWKGDSGGEQVNLGLGTFEVADGYQTGVFRLSAKLEDLRKSKDISGETYLGPNDHLTVELRDSGEKVGELIVYGPINFYGKAETSQCRTFND